MRRPGRALLVAGVAVAALALGGWIAFRAATRESSEPASVTAALARFRALPPSARTLPPALRGRAPAPGVYVYATRGAEVSHVLGTRRHAYPARTTATVSVTPRGCVRTRWDALASRWDARLVCRQGDLPRLVSLSEAHRFAGHADRRTYRCTRDSTPQRSRCAIAGTTTADAVVALGPRTLPLDGRRVRALLLRTTTRVRGDTVGAGTTLTWVLPRTGLVVKRTIANANVTDTVVGDVRYEERATLALTSARPLR